MQRHAFVIQTNVIKYDLVTQKIIVTCQKKKLLINVGIKLQVSVDIHGRYNRASNEALCLEILGVLKRCFSQQADIRLSLYQVKPSSKSKKYDVQFIAKLYRVRSCRIR